MFCLFFYKIDFCEGVLYNCFKYGIEAGMVKDKRYELLCKLSDFYVKEVKNKLDIYNEARKISNAGVSCIPVTISVTLVFFLLIFLCIPSDNVLFLLILLFVLYFLYCLSLQFLFLPWLRKRDKANKIHVLRYGSEGKVFLPQSADNEIKKHLMHQFVRLFGDFDWNQNYTSKKWGSNRKDYKFLQSLKIVNSLFIFFDDCIWGNYTGVNLRILEANTSLFQLKAMVVLIVGTMIAAMFAIPIITVIFPIFALFAKVLPYIIVAAITGFVVFKSAFNKSFRGVFVEIDMNKKFEGHTFILEKDDYRNKAAAKLQGYELVKLEDPEFERQYAVYSQSQIESRYILTPSFMERIKAIKDTYKAKYVRVSFKDEKIVVAIHTGRDMFKMAGTKNMTKETFLQLFNEIVSVLALVETLKLNQKLGL